MAQAAEASMSVVAKPLAPLVPMAHVAEVERSIAWYAKLGFVAEHPWRPEGRPLQWAEPRSGGAVLMLVRGPAHESGRAGRFVPSVRGRGSFVSGEVLRDV